MESRCLAIATSDQLRPIHLPRLKLFGPLLIGPRGPIIRALEPANLAQGEPSGIAAD